MSFLNLAGNSMSAISCQQNIWALSFSSDPRLDLDLDLVLDLVVDIFETSSSL